MPASTPLCGSRGNSALLHRDRRGGLALGNGLGELGLLLATRRVEVELLDEEGEEEEVQSGVNDSKHQHNRPVGLVDTEDQVGNHDVDDAACSRSGHGEDLEQDRKMPERTE